MLLVHVGGGLLRSAVMRTVGLPGCRAMTATSAHVQVASQSLYNKLHVSNRSHVMFCEPHTQHSFYGSALRRSNPLQGIAPPLRSSERSRSAAQRHPWLQAHIPVPCALLPRGTGGPARRARGAGALRPCIW